MSVLYQEHKQKTHVERIKKLNAIGVDVPHDLEKWSDELFTRFYNDHIRGRAEQKRIYRIGKFRFEMLNAINNDCYDLYELGRLDPSEFSHLFNQVSATAYAKSLNNG